MVQRFSLRTAPPLKYKGNRVNAPYENSLLSLIAQKQNVLNQWSNAGVERVAKQARQYKRKVKVNNKNTAKKLTSAINDYLTTSNDATLIADNRPKNIHLKDRTIHGAESHAAWAKDNPALNKLGLALGAAPFAVMAAPFALKAAPYLSNSYLLGRVGSTLAGKTGSAVGGAIGNGIDLGLSGAGIYNGVKTLADSNADAFDKTLGVVNGVASSIPLVNTGKMAFRSSFANNVVPLGYNNEAGQTNYTKGKQIGRTFAETLMKTLSLRANKTVSQTPYWMKRLNVNDFDNVNGTALSGSTNLKYRQDAINLAMRQPTFNSTYVKNSDGTYSYNQMMVPRKSNTYLVKNINKETGRPNIESIWNKDLFNINKKTGNPDIESIWNKDLVNRMKDGESVLAVDNLAGNGGYVSIIKENGKLYMTDKWDVQPFKDKYRLPIGTLIGPFAKFMNIVRPNFEVVKFSGGNPFILKTPLKID